MLHNKNLILEFKRNAATAILSIASISLIVTILFLFSLNGSEIKNDARIVNAIVKIVYMKVVHNALIYSGS